jgi:hypothetical protein
MRIVGRGATPIRTLDDWEHSAAPTGGARQWAEGRSALECARAWVGRRGPAPPEEIENLLDEHADTRGFAFGLVAPEVRVPVDEYRGSTRNIDVLACGRVHEIPTVIAIAAKVDEPFGPTIAEALRRAREGSKVPDRIGRLCQLVLRCSLEKTMKSTPDLRYQLLHGLGAAILAASQMNVRQAVFVVHEFHARAATLSQYAANSHDWHAFLAAVGVEDLDVGELAALEWRPNDVHCLVGKAMVDLG